MLPPSSTTTGEPRAGSPRPVPMRPDLFAGARCAAKRVAHAPGRSPTPRCARTANLYRVKVKQPLQNQREWSQVVDSAFDRMGQLGPIVRAMGHKGPNFSGASAHIVPIRPLRFPGPSLNQVGPGTPAIKQHERTAPVRIGSMRGLGHGRNCELFINEG